MIQTNNKKKSKTFDCSQYLSEKGTFIWSAAVWQKYQIMNGTNSCLMDLNLNIFSRRVGCATFGFVARGSVHLTCIASTGDTGDRCIARLPSPIVFCRFFGSAWTKPEGEERLLISIGLQNFRWHGWAKAETKAQGESILVEKPNTVFPHTNAADNQLSTRDQVTRSDTVRIILNAVDERSVPCPRITWKGWVNDWLSQKSISHLSWATKF